MTKSNWVFLCMVLLAGGFATRAARADVDVGSGFSMLGDFRFRYDLDHNASTDKDRERPRIRARAGSTFRKDDWEMGLRLRTQSDDNNSPYRTLGVAGSASLNPAFGLDRAYGKWSFSSDGWAWAGKNALPVWQQSEVFWDEDTQAEGFAVGQKIIDGLTVQASRVYLNNEGFQSDFMKNDTFSTLQFVYTADVGVVNGTAALTAAHLGDTGARAFGSMNFYVASVQLKHTINECAFLLGGDYLKGTAAGENSGFVVQARVTHGKAGFRVYHYDIGETSVPFYSTGGKTFFFTQDNFPSSAAAPVNFRGEQFQLEYAVSDKLRADLRVYLVKGKGAGTFGIGETANLNRYQLNLDMSI